MTTTPRPRRPSDPVMQMLVPRLYRSTPTLFGAPLAQTEGDLRNARVALLAIPWRAPTPDTQWDGLQQTMRGSN
jgi:hypothetical protein